MEALVKLEAPELDEASSSSQSCTGILFTIQDPTAQVCRLKFQALVGFRWVSEWASKANLLKFSWPGALMILCIPLQRKLQLSSQDEQHVGWNRSHALSSSSRGFLLQKQILNFSEEGISQPEEQLRTSFKSSLQADSRKSNSQHQIQVEGLGRSWAVARNL